MGKDVGGTKTRTPEYGRLGLVFVLATSFRTPIAKSPEPGPSLVRRQQIPVRVLGVLVFVGEQSWQKTCIHVSNCILVVADARILVLRGAEGRSALKVGQPQGCAHGMAGALD